MPRIKTTVLVSMLAAQVALFQTPPVSALPVSPGAGGAEFIQLKGRPAIEVRNQGAGVAAGIIGGMILGGIIASQPPHYYYGDYPAYPPYQAYPPYPGYSRGDGAIAYCMRRFRSYDPYSMTYLGHDGFRHPCP
jgi:hypothetical protein